MSPRIPTKTSQRFCASLRHPCPLLALFAIPATLTLFLSPHYLPRPPTRLPPSLRSPSLSTADTCLFLTAPHLPYPQFNSRSLCLSPLTCLSPAAQTLYTSSSPPTCHLAGPAFNPTGPSLPSCHNLRRTSVLCAHGSGLASNRPSCPHIASLRSVNLSSPHTAWISAPSILVPAYPHAASIYHFANIVTTVAHVADALPPLLGRAHLPALTLIFRARPNRNHWQTHLSKRVLMRRLRTVAAKVSIRHVDDDSVRAQMCMRDVVVLGRRGHVNVWPFPNVTRVSLEGDAVPADAIAFKRAAYEAFGIPASWPEPERGIAELPPLVVGYARRLGASGRVGGNVHFSGTTRAFSEEDEAWFTQMLQEETTGAGVGLKVFATSDADPLEEQARLLSGVGFVVGIHGANLVNAIFMRAFGGLLEIFPANSTSQCYVAGANSGLAYLKYTSSEAATPEESGCGARHVKCQTTTRHRRVKLGAEHDRKEVRRLVKEGIARLGRLHNRYSRGIPVQYNADTGYFHVTAPPTRFGLLPRATTKAGR